MEPWIHSLSDDLITRILRVAPSRKERYQLMGVCRRWASLLRTEEVLHLVVCFLYSGVSVAACGEITEDRHGEAVCEVTTLLSMRTTPLVARKLQHACELLRLAYRRAFSSIRLRGVRFVGYHNLWTVLPVAVQKIPAAVLAGGSPCSPTPSSQALDVHLCHCSLPTGLGALLGPNVRQLRIWDCWPIHHTEVAVRALLLGMADLSRLEQLVWGCEELPTDVDMNAPAEVVEWLPVGLRRLGLSLRDASFEQHQLDEHRLHQVSEAWLRLAPSLEALAVFGTSHGEESGGFADAIFFHSLARVVATGAMGRLRELQMGRDRMALVLDALGGLGSLFKACPGLRSLGAVDCSWANPSQYFESLPATYDARAAGHESAEGGDRPLQELASLRVYINSPSGCPQNIESEWGCASCDGPDAACALSHAVHNVLYRLSSLQKLYVEWYEEQDLPILKLVRVLCPLTYCQCLRECHLLRFNSDCGVIIGVDGSRLDEQQASTALEELMAPLRVNARYFGSQTRNGDAPDWLVEDSVELSETCHGIAQCE